MRHVAAALAYLFTLMAVLCTVLLKRPSCALWAMVLIGMLLTVTLLAQCLAGCVRLKLPVDWKWKPKVTLKPTSLSGRRSLSNALPKGRR